MKQAVILVGGKGTRLKERLGSLPKPLIKIAGKALLERQLEILQEYNILDVVFLTSYKSELIIKFCKQKKFNKFNFSFFIDENPLGTAGALLQIVENLKDDFFVIYGDVLFNIDLKRFYSHHKKIKNIAATIFLHPNDHPYDSDIVSLDSAGFVREFHPYPHIKGSYYKNLVNAAFYIINKRYLLKYKNFRTPSDLAKDFFPFILEKDHKINSYISPEYIKDIGTPDRLDLAESHLKKGLINRSNLKYPQKAVFIDRDGTLNKDSNGYISTINDLFVYPHVGDAIRKLNHNEWKVIIITNQPLLAKGVMNKSQLENIHNKLEYEISKSNGFIDAIYYCPHHPDKGFDGEVASLKIKCNCRKPRNLLIRKAQKQFNIDLKKSWFIGDSSADLGVAINSNLSSITVLTGNGGLDYKYSFQPQFHSKNFSTSVSFILNEYPVIKQKLGKIISNIKTNYNKSNFDNNWFVSGLSKSGKSMVSNILKKELCLIGIETMVISLDRWLLPEPQRGSNVYERYNLKEIKKVFNKINKKLKVISFNINLPNYSKIKKAPLNSFEKCFIKNNSIIIWEGLVVDKILPKIHSNLIYVSTDENRRKQIIIDEYKKRGQNDKEITNLLNNRNIDEVSMIKKIKKLANYKVLINDCFKDAS